MTSDFGCLICSTSQGWAFQSASMLRVWVCKLIWRALSGTGKTETPNYQTCLNTFSLEFGFSPWHSLSSCVFEVLGCFPSQSLFSLSAKPHLMTQWDLFVVFFSFFFSPCSEILNCNFHHSFVCYIMHAGLDSQHSVELSGFLPAENLCQHFWLQSKTFGKEAHWVSNWFWHPGTASVWQRPSMRDMATGRKVKCHDFSVLLLIVFHDDDILWIKGWVKN